MIERLLAARDTFRLYGQIPNVFEVRAQLKIRLIEGGIGGFELTEVPLPVPYMKDYDALDGGGPASWVDKFEIGKSAVFLHKACSGYTGGAVVAFDTPELVPMEVDQNTAVLWDIRVHPNFRGEGIGTKLFNSAEEWARKQGCTNLLAETQNINLPACRFYAQQGCELRAIDRFTYTTEPEIAHEIMLLWRKALD